MAPLCTAISLYGTIVYIPCAVITLCVPVIVEGFVY